MKCNTCHGTACQGGLACGPTMPEPIVLGPDPEAPPPDDCDCEVTDSDRCIHCGRRFICSQYGWCELHGEHGP